MHNAPCAGIGRAPGVAALELYRLLVFAYLSGNGDLHAKNLAILRDQQGEWRIPPVILDTRNDRLRLRRHPALARLVLGADPVSTRTLSLPIDCPLPEARGREEWDHFHVRT